MNRDNLFLPGLFIAMGLVISGYFIGNGFYKSKALDRYVTVKGLAEREVNANMAIWPISFVETSNDLNELQENLEKESERIRRYLQDAGFDPEEITIGVPSIIDFQAQQYYDPNQSRRYRYLGRRKLTVQTADVGQLMRAMSGVSGLIGEGIVIEQGDYNSQIQFLFTELNDIKPDMIEEATTNAREAADKFAQDSGSEVGQIRKATQGLFTIRDRDLNSPHIKIVRVVSTIEFYLKD